MSLLDMPVKKNSVLWKKLLKCMDSSMLSLSRLEADLSLDPDEYSMDEVKMIDDCTTQLEAFVAQEFVSAIIAAGKAMCKKLKTIVQACNDVKRELHDDNRLSNSLKACSKFRRFMTRNKKFIQNQPEFFRLLYSIIRYEDIFRLKKTIIVV
ncbi:hypothetical protein SteCoe_37244 [Stentor coeruleus]|uniref:Uncharacterized protein n=1 Tax=Stentor coeruleus TaxID=5963 RepID=A0A1R2ANF2_9CILI|nr:hypothetical protein SteCoe_37244 [Stentor coeruleus]